MTIQYQKITLGDWKGTEIFVRTKDFRAMQRVMKNREPKKVVEASIQLLLGSPEGFTMMNKGITAISHIMQCRNKKILENMRDMIDYELKKLKKPKKKAKVSGSQKTSLKEDKHD